MVSYKEEAISIIEDTYLVTVSKKMSCKLMAILGLILIMYVLICVKLGSNSVNGRGYKPCCGRVDNHGGNT